MRVRGPLLAALLLATAGCASTEVDRPTGPRLGTYTPAQVSDAAERLLAHLDVDASMRTRLLAEVQEALQDPDLGGPVSAVGAYRVRGGGFGMRVTVGGGEVSFAGGSQARGFNVKSLVFGAVAGFDVVRGVILAAGLQREADLPGNYDVSVRGASAGTLGAKLCVATPKWKAPHRVVLIGVGLGVSGEAGLGSATITFVDPTLQPPPPAKE